MLKWFKKLFGQNSTFQQDIEGIEHHINEIIEDEKRKSEIINLQVWIDKPIIIISNNYPFIEVGFGRDITFISQAQNPILVYDSYSETPVEIKQKISLASVVMFYDELKLDALLKLSPCEIEHLFYGRYTYLTEIVIDEENSLEQTVHIKEKESYLLWNGFGQAVEAHYTKG